jgi:formamidopyrimidine-DNA glycosylase
VPELPELEAVRRRLGPRLEQRTIVTAEVNPRHAHLLRYPPGDFADQLAGGRFLKAWRRGKHLIFDLELRAQGDRRHLAINPMLGGRFQLATVATSRPNSWVFALGFQGEEEFRYLDLREMGRIYLARDLTAEVPGWDELGPEANEIDALGLESFRRRLRRRRDELKDLLRNQAFLAGIGNAYSDEILFAAQLLPLRRRASLQPAEEEALFTAISTVLPDSVAKILADPNYDEARQNRSFMRVHGRGGQPCPRCGHRISQLGSRREPLSFCRGCQR